MKVSVAFQCALGAAVFGLSLALREKKTRGLQRERILTYDPLTQVTDPAAIDIDQIAMESMLPVGSSEAMAQALSMYTNGGFSGSYAILTLSTPVSSAIDFNLTEGTIVSGESFENGQEVRGRLMEPLTGGDTRVVVQYETTDNQRSYVGCQVGGNPNPFLDGCFASSGDVVIGDPKDVFTVNFAYNYNVLTDNKNSRTLQGLSTTAKKNLYDCINCPYNTYEKFYNYYNQFDYGNEWILAAFNRGSTNFANGNADFSGYGENEMAGVVEAIKKGTVFLNVYMEVVKSMENTVDKCQAGEESRFQPWDEAVAFYVGSMAKVTNGSEGNFLYSNAKKRCRNFGTCDTSNSEARANSEILDQFILAQRNLFDGKCEEVQLAKNRITNLMAVPLIQGTLRFAFLMDQEGIVDARSDVTSGTFAASILPLVHSCSPVDALVLHSNMRVGATSVSFADVKSALERNYRCMGLTCADIGGLLSNNGYVDGAEPCDDNSMTFNETPKTTSAAPEIAAPTTAVSSVAPTHSEAHTTVEEIPANATTTAPSAEELPVNKTRPPVEIFSSDPSKCPPCSQPIIGNEPVTASKSLNECPILLEQHKDSIGIGCECACFIDFEFAFCAKESITYTGSGLLVGPCEVDQQDSLIEEDATVEDFGKPTKEPAPVEFTLADDASSVSNTSTENFTIVADNSTNAVELEQEGSDIDESDFTIAAAETESSARVNLLAGFVTFCVVMTCAFVLL